MKRYLLFFLLLPAACNPLPSRGTRDLFSVKTATADGSVFDLSTLKNSRAFVMVFLAPDCPLSQNYIATLNALREQFDADEVEFLGVVAGEWFDRAEVRHFTETYKVRFPVLLDRDFHLADALGATITPEAFMLDSRGDILYKGAIDNGAADLTQHRTVITEHYLRDALTYHLQDQIVPVGSTEAVGCFIERKN